jgi:hypothetical protein
VLVEAVVDPNEPPIPGHTTIKQAWHFAKAMLRGQPESMDIVKKQVADKIREVI